MIMFEELYDILILVLEITIAINVIIAIILAYLHIMSKPLFLTMDIGDSMIKFKSYGRIFSFEPYHLVVKKYGILKRTIKVPKNGLIRIDIGDEHGYCVIPTEITVKKKWHMIREVVISEYITLSQLREFYLSKSVLSAINKGREELESKSRETMKEITTMSVEASTKVSEMIDVAISSLRETLGNAKSLISLMAELHGVEPEEIDYEKMLSLLKQIEGD